MKNTKFYSFLKGRGFFSMNAMTILEELQTNPKNTDKGGLVAKHATRAIQVIKWRP